MSPRVGSREQQIRDVGAGNQEHGADRAHQHPQHPGDAADDVAIWIDQRRPADSVVIGTNKKDGLHAYD
ncbi:MAG: phytase, partial [Lysobacterales bacterium]